MDAATIQIIADIIKTVGFPVAVSAYVLWRSDNLQLKILSVVNELASLLKTHVDDTKKQTEQDQRVEDRVEELQDQIKELSIRLSVKGQDK